MCFRGPPGTKCTINSKNVRQNTQLYLRGPPGTKCTINSKNVHQNTIVYSDGQQNGSVTDSETKTQCREEHIQEKRMKRLKKQGELYNVVKFSVIAAFEVTANLQCREEYSQEKRMKRLKNQGLLYNVVKFSVITAGQITV